MFDRKQHGRGLCDGIARSLKLATRLRDLALTLAALVVIANIDTAPPVAADEDLAGARLVCALGFGGERNYCASTTKRGGRHG